MAKRKPDFEMEAYADDMTSKAKKAALGQTGERGRELREIVNEGNVVNLEPMNAEAHAAAQQAAADREMARWAKTNPDLYEQFVNSQKPTRPIDGNIGKYGELNTGATIGKKSINRYNMYPWTSRELFSIQRNAGLPSTAKRWYPEVTPNGRIDWNLGGNAYNTRPYVNNMVVPPRDINRLGINYPQGLLPNPNALEGYMSPADMQAGLNPNFERVPMPSEVEPSVVQPKPEPYAARNAAGKLETGYPTYISNEVMDDGYPIARVIDKRFPFFSDDAQEYGQGSTAPITKAQAVTNRLADSMEARRDARLEGGVAAVPQNYDKTGRPTGKTMSRSQGDLNEMASNLQELSAKNSIEAYRRGRPMNGIKTKGENVWSKDGRLLEFNNDGYSHTGKNAQSTYEAGGKNLAQGMWNKGMKYPAGKASNPFTVPKSMEGAVNAAKANGAQLGYAGLAVANALDKAAVAAVPLTLAVDAAMVNQNYSEQDRRAMNAQIEDMRNIGMSEEEIRENIIRQLTEESNYLLSE